MKPHPLEDLQVRRHESDLHALQRRHEPRDPIPTDRGLLKNLHWMHCPKCGMQLTSELHGSVEIDVCPSCRGVWLDSTELETIVAAESRFFRSCLRTIGGPCRFTRTQLTAT